MQDRRQMGTSYGSPSLPAAVGEAQELAFNGEVDPLIAWPGLLAREAHIL